MTALIRRHHGILTPMLLLSPVVLMVLFVIALPLAFSFYASLTPFRLLRPESIETFIGFRNYVRLFGDGDFWAAFLRTLLFLTVALNAELALGLGAALLINRVTWGRHALRTVMMFPMMFSPVLVGFQFKYIFDDNVGLLNNALQSLGLVEYAIPWLVDDRLAMTAILVAEIWMSSAVFAVLLLAGLFAMPPDSLEAAEMDGCTPWQSFRHITLPFLAPFAYIAMTIRSLDIARAYDIVAIMTDGGPGGRTELLWTMIDRVGFDNARMGQASAMAFLSSLLSIAFTWFLFARLIKARRRLGAME